jgi:hypothetical protein
MTTTPVLDTLTSMLETEVALDAWDVPPWIGILFEDRGKVSSRPFRFSTEFWGLAHPVVAVETIAKAIEAIGLPDHLYVQNDEQYVGVMLFNEGWGLISSGDDPDSDAKKKAGEDHTIHLRDDRIELKIMSAVARSGTRYMVQVARGSEHPEVYEATDNTLEGRVFDALTKLERSVRNAQGEQ